jgi:hypothetical protein
MLLLQIQRDMVHVLVVWTSLGPLPRWVPGPTTGRPLGLLGLCHTTPDGVGRKYYGEGVLE